MIKTDWIAPSASDPLFNKVSKIQENVRQGLTKFSDDLAQEASNLVLGWEPQKWLLVAPTAGELVWQVETKRAQQAKAAAEAEKKAAKVAAIQLKKEKAREKQQKSYDDAPKKILALLKKYKGGGVTLMDLMAVGPKLLDGSPDRDRLFLVMHALAAKVPLDYSNSKGEWTNFRVRDSQADFAGTGLDHFNFVRLSES